jgi:hypothetical protein
MRDELKGKVKREGEKKEYIVLGAAKIFNFGICARFLSPKIIGRKSCYSEALIFVPFFLYVTTPSPFTFLPSPYLLLSLSFLSLLLLFLFPIPIIPIPLLFFLSSSPHIFSYFISRHSLFPYLL